MDFWFSIGSTYSYLTVMRLEAAAAAAGVAVTWRPFNVRTIMIEQNNIPFKDKPVKTAYMWRDMERRAALHGLSISVPARYPLPELALANQVAILGMREGWGVSYVKRSYERWFIHGERPGEEPNLSNALAGLGDEVPVLIERARAADVAADLDRATDLAKEAGVFGSPTFVVDGEIFWGDDRLEDALDWATGARRI